MTKEVGVNLIAYGTYQFVSDIQYVTVSYLCIDTFIHKITCVLCQCPSAVILRERKKRFCDKKVILTLRQYFYYSSLTFHSSLRVASDIDKSNKHCSLTLIVSLLCPDLVRVCLRLSGQPPPESWPSEELADNLHPNCTLLQMVCWLCSSLMSASLFEHKHSKFKKKKKWKLGSNNNSISVCHADLCTYSGTMF